MLLAKGASPFDAPSTANLPSAPDSSPQATAPAGLSFPIMSTGITRAVPRGQHASSLSAAMVLPAPQRAASLPPPGPERKEVVVPRVSPQARLGSSSPGPTPHVSPQARLGSSSPSPRWSPSKSAAADIPLPAAPAAAARWTPKPPRPSPRHRARGGVDDDADSWASTSDDELSSSEEDSVRARVCAARALLLRASSAPVPAGVVWGLADAEPAQDAIRLGGEDAPAPAGPSTPVPGAASGGSPPSHGAAGAGSDPAATQGSPRARAHEEWQGQYAAWQESFAAWRLAMSDWAAEHGDGRAVA
ncbi:hypothetical protein F751_6479 [Auxenochlorella protothecoides]|uniref:Uncharacterized protein n=1 Tax=Auxenochlorella protothecoides TaxID=3075 RepID=A0A087STA6_AUXPR|nr:hypothetical protein F751_6479 [Auxenochlorella protothecoides]KFM28960.1 hypothetical protein F751_6479 [Auxenochlorella protothecoides]